MASSLGNVKSSEFNLICICICSVLFCFVYLILYSLCIMHYNIYLLYIKLIVDLLIERM